MPALTQTAAFAETEAEARTALLKPPFPLREHPADPRRIVTGVWQDRFYAGSLTVTGSTCPLKRQRKEQGGRDG